MPQRDMKNSMQVVHCGNLTLSGTTPASSDWVDTRGFDSCTFLLVNNTVTDAGTAAGFTTEVQDGDDTTDAGAVAVVNAQLTDLETDLTVTLDTADDDIAGAIGYLGAKRYARLDVTGTTGTDADCSVIAILMKAATAPPTSVGTALAAT